MKKLLSILGMTNFIVIGTSLIISCSHKLIKPIEQPKIDISSITSIESPTKIIAKNPLKVDLTEVKNALKPQVFKELTKIDNTLTENDFDIAVWIFVNDNVTITEPYDLTTQKFAKIKIIGYRKTNDTLTDFIPVNLPVATTS